MSDEATTRRVTPAELEENFALRDEIKQLRVLIAAIIRGSGGLITIHNHWFEKVSSGDTFIKEDDLLNDSIVLTFEGKP